jgi:hypothetical protein
MILVETSSERNGTSATSSDNGTALCGIHPKSDRESLLLSLAHSPTSDNIFCLLPLAPGSSNPSRRVNKRKQVPRDMVAWRRGWWYSDEAVDEETNSSQPSPSNIVESTG